MPYPTDESDTNTLPDPELNPLLNPLLGAHMGRWAEVYFTSPPEKREQAVAELIRELKNTAPAEFVSAQAISAEKAGDETSQEPQADLVEPPRTCSACAYENSPGQNFCGMCGVPLHVLPEPEVSRITESVPSESTWSAPEPTPGYDSPEHSTEPAVRSPAAESNRGLQESTWPLPENELPHFAVEPEPVPYRYRIYVGAALAILLVTMVYMSWRGTKAMSGTAGPQSVPSKVTAPAPAATTQQPKAMPSVSPAINPPAHAAGGETEPDATRRKSEIANARPASRIVKKAAISASVAPEQSGAEDLATAQKYLNGTQGTARDSREAAMWLWKAVGKGNPAATLTLSDLYLRGDGVPKSCDQARLLLDAAARKGARAASERLRNLQAFGCQ